MVELRRGERVNCGLDILCDNLLSISVLKKTDLKTSNSMLIVDGTDASI